MLNRRSEGRSFSIKKKGRYLLTVYTGNQTIELMETLLRKIQQAARSTRCRSVFVDLRQSTRGLTTDEKLQLSRLRRDRNQAKRYTVSGRINTMPLDHFVSQVHLRRFCSPIFKNRLYAIRKSDLHAFTPVPKDICRIMNGNANPFLREPRAIEDFLKTIEPQYNNAVDNLAGGQVTADTVYTIAGFVAYVASCSPAAMRVYSEPFQRVVETTGLMMDSKGLLPPPPPELGVGSFSELVKNGGLTVDVDPKYPQAMGIASILIRVMAFGNFKWDIIVNGFTDSPFFTSDFPVAIETTQDPRILNRIVPLAPNVAIRIRPDPTIDKSKFDLSFSNFGWRRYDVDRSELLTINRAIVRCAESEVYFRDDFPWVTSFVKRNRWYRIEPHTWRLPAHRGVIQFSTQRVVERSH